MNRILNIRHTSLMAGFFVLSLCLGACESNSEAEKSNASESPYITLRVNYGNERTDKVVDSLKCEENMTIYALMKQIPDLELTEKAYEGAGTLITGIDGAHNDGQHFWVYCVNGAYASTAADNYVLEPGDQVSWYLTDDSSPCD